MLKQNKNIKDVIYIVDNLREEDLAETKALWGKNWRKKTIENIMNTDFLILYSYEIPIAIGGFVPVTSSHIKLACVWLLCSKDVKRNKLKLFKTLKSQIEKESLNFEIFYNYIYKSNKEAKRWLKKLGFCFENPNPEKLLIHKNFEFFYRKNK